MGRRSSRARKGVLLAASLGGLAGLGGACNLDWSVPTADAGGGDSATSEGGAADVGGVDVARPTDPSGDASGPKNPGACFTTTECPPDTYCRFPDLQCGRLGTAGVCTPLKGTGGVDCQPQPTCGCDGKVYDSPCSALLAGADLGVGCDASQTPQLACGPHFCAQEQLCLFSTSAPERDASQCVKATCATGPDCACEVPAYCQGGGECKGRLLRCP